MLWNSGLMSGAGIHGGSGTTVRHVFCSAVISGGRTLWARLASVSVSDAGPTAVPGSTGVTEAAWSVSLEPCKPCMKNGWDLPQLMRIHMIMYVLSMNADNNPCYKSSASTATASLASMHMSNLKFRLCIRPYRSVGTMNAPAQVPMSLKQAERFGLQSQQNICMMARGTTMLCLQLVRTFQKHLLGVALFGRAFRAVS